MITTIASIEEAIGKSKVLVGRCISRGPGTKPSTCKQRLLLQKKFNSCHWKKCFEMLKKLNKKNLRLRINILHAYIKFCEKPTMFVTCVKKTTFFYTEFWTRRFDSRVQMLPLFQLRF
jgi:hypothetical protein